MNTILQIIAIFLAGLCAVSSLLLFIRLSWPAPSLWFLKIFTSALSPILAIIGLLTMVTGLATGSVFISIAGLYVALIYTYHIYMISRPPEFPFSFEHAFGGDWERQISPGQKTNFLPRRMMFRLPSLPAPELEQNISYASIPGTDRNLLCDIWQPAENFKRSGLAFINLHGSAFYFLDKDCGTRTFFHHLAAQGHVIMDIAYRLSPETDVMGMIQDAKRAIAWMKENAAVYHINPNGIVIGGGSAGGHLALLAAYTANNSMFTPVDLQGKDLSVCSVISLYGSSDMKDIYYHTNQHLTTVETPGKPKKKVPTKMPGWIRKKMGNDFHRLGMDKGFENAGALAPLLGGHPGQCPGTYALFSVGTHVHKNCPATLLIHGEQDIMAPVKSTRDLFNKLVTKNIPVVMHILPQTDHAFDLPLPRLSVSAHNEMYDVERFLAYTANRVERTVPEKAEVLDHKFFILQEEESILAHLN